MAARLRSFSFPALPRTLAALAAFAPLCLASAPPPGPTPNASPARNPAPLRARVPMRDGVMLAANVFLPPGGGRHPAILVRTPYGKGEQILAGYQLFTSHNYAVVVQDVRGRYGSQGAFDGLAREGPDSSDTMNWIARQAWSNGEVVMSGGSYLGFAQWDAALQENPHLKAIFPVVSGCDTFTDRFYSPGGAIKLGHRLSWFAGNLAAPGYHASFSSYIWHLPLRTSDRAATGRRLDAFQAALNHPAYDAYWKSLSVCAHIDQVHVPVYSVGGWYDNYAESDLRAFQDLARLGRRPHLIVGPWPHNMSFQFAGSPFGAQSSAPIKRYQLTWYDRVLSRPSEPEPAARLDYFLMGANRWESAPGWPPPDARPVSFYLAGRGHANGAQGDGALALEPEREAADQFVYDPRNPVPTRGGAVCCDPRLFPWGPLDQRPVEQRPDVLVYSSAPLRNELEVAGPVSVRLWVATTAKDTDFTAKLVDVFPSGEARNLTDGILRLRYRGGLDRMAPVLPGQVMEIRIDAGPTANAFLPGHRIRLEVSSSNFPRFNRNLNTGGPIADEVTPRTARQTVYHGGARASALILPVVRPAGQKSARLRRPAG